MHFAPLICRCYVFLYICLPFNTSFWEVPKHTLFASQKKREVRLSWVWYTILFFLFQSCCLLNTILSFQKFASITESFIHQFLVSSFASWVSFGVSFWIFCPLSGWDCLLYWVSVHHVQKFEYRFIVLREFDISTSLLNMSMSQPEHVLQHKKAENIGKNSWFKEIRHSFAVETLTML